MILFELTDNDRVLLEKKGISESIVHQQINLFAKGAGYRNILRPCMPGDGIHRFSPEEQTKFQNLYEQKIHHLAPVKFVPASGAASRMFKDLSAYSEGTDNERIIKKTELFIDNIREFAFYNDLKKRISEDGKNIDDLITAGGTAGVFKTVVDYLLTDKGLGYKHLPKGLLKFHSYPDYERTPFEEHLAEAAVYAKGGDMSRLHFTVSEEHIEAFKELFDSIRDRYESTYKTTYDVHYSIQAPQTDTISVDENNTPFRTDDGSVLMRPGGHGSLIANLNKIHSDMVFIKNIDNVLPERLNGVTNKWKKILGGLLLYIQEHFFDFLRRIENMEKNGRYDQAVLDDAISFAEMYLHTDTSGHSSSEEKAGYLTAKLNRPLRVCGMVVNRGEPGGGPFWVDEGKGMDPSLQIVEMSEIDMNNETFRNIVQKAGYFNPVDLVVSFKTYKGEFFDLDRYVNPDTFFITQKSIDGRPVKALEHPGLWNGGMWRWNTVFVEVPEETFNPVKTVFDLLRESHLS